MLAVFPFTYLKQPFETEEYLASFASKADSTLLIVGFGVLAGTGIGFGYGSTTPPAGKWFSPAKRGLITGIVVAGFGLGPVYISPITKNLLKSIGINQTFMILGIGYYKGAHLSVLHTAAFSTTVENILS